MVSSLETGSTFLTVTIQVPQPPSKHINLVPDKCAWFLINVFNVVLTGIVSGFAEK